MFLFQNMRIANAYELAAGNDTSDVSFDQGKMRNHLVQCLEKGRFCYCSMSECWDDMVQYEFVILDPSTANNR